MGVLAMRARAELRHRVRSALLLVLAIGIAAGVTLAAFAGARRTESAVDRFVAYSRPSQGVVFGDPALYPRIARLPQVEATVVGARILMAPIDAGGRPVRDARLGEIAVGSFDFSRPIVVEGRVPRPDRIGEIAINPSAAAQNHLHVGSALRLQAFAPSAAQDLLRGKIVAPTGPIVTVHVVGIGRFPADLSVAQASPGVVFTSNDNAYFTPAFLRKYKDRVAIAGGIALSFRARGGAAGIASFQAAVAKVSAGKAQVFTGSDDLAAASQARHATGLEALALLLFGILAGLVTLTLIAQAFARQVYLDAVDYPTLHAMGMTRRQLVVVAALRATMLGLAGTAAAIGVAILASSRMPIGLARQAEVHPGVSIDGAVLLIGASAIVAFLTAWTAVVAWRAAGQAGASADRRAIGGRRASRIAHALSQAGSPPSATVGASMAFESGRGSSAVPVRTTFVSAVVAVTVVMGALTFGANLTRLADHPRLQGWNWDVAVGNPHSDDVSKTAIPRLASNSSVAAISAIAGADGLSARINGHDAGLIAIDAVKGPSLVPYLAGRAPTGANEIAFGTKTMREAHLAIGQRVTVSTGGPTLTMRITGRVLLTPSVVNDSMPLGEAVVVSGAARRALHAEAAVNVFLVRFGPHVDRSAALRRLQADFPGVVLPPVRPPDIENLQRVDHLPTLLAGLFALVALLTIGNTLVSSVRRRRRELAILRTVGFVRRQVSATVAWQASFVAVVGVLIGVPLGVAAGRSTWTLVTDRLGLPADAVTPGTLLVLTVVLSIVAANAVAVGPGILATRTAPATILHSE